MSETPQKERTFAEKFRRRPTWLQGGLTSNESSREKSPDEPLQLSIALQRQAEGEPDHWSLFIAREGQRGTVHQVKGDNLCMRYNQAQGVLLPASASFKTAYTIAEITEEQAETVRECAEAEDPPHAENVRAIEANCQDWVVKVVERLVAKGVVQQSKLNIVIDLRRNNPR